MKNRRILISLLIALLLAAGLSACQNTNGPKGTDTSVTLPITPPSTLPGSTPGTEAGGQITDLGLLTFADTAGVSYQSDYRSGSELAKGTKVTFSLGISKFYEGTPTVTVGGETIEPSGGRYTVEIKGDTRVEVSGVSLKASSIEGSGTTSDDPYLITSAVDLLTVAKEVNAGNTAYTRAYYALSGDIDFEGEEFEVIGNGATENAYFAGYFDGRGYTVSNFRIETTDSSYVGFFGILQANTAGTAGGAIYKLNLKDFTIRASRKDASLFCGSFAGYGVGSSILLCSAENGTIEIYADSSNLAYAGGIVGLAQGLDYNDYAYLAAVTYSSASVDIDGREGAIFSAGGIAGYLAASDGEKTVSSVNNCYSTGDIQGAMRSGGVVGYLSTQTSVSSCYSTGIVSAQTSITDTDNSEVFCYAYAGGVVGYAEQDTAIAESFSTAKVYCKSGIGTDYEGKDGIIGCIAEVDEGAYAAHPATVFNCRHAEAGSDDAKKLMTADYLRSELHWNDCDWSYAEGSYPTFNMEENNEYSFDITFKFPGSPDVTVSEFDAYMPMQFWYLGDILPRRLIGDEGDSHASYGYFFDEALTQPIPECYVPTRTITVYVGTADYGEVAGSYALDLVGNGSPAYLTLGVDGNFSYTDGAETITSIYRYDGSTLVFEDARLGRYSGIELSMSRYQFVDFVGKYADGRLTITGGVVTDGDTTVTFFTESSPLVAVSLDRGISGSYRSGNTVYTFAPGGTGSLTSADGESTDFDYTLSGGTLTVRMGNTTLHGSFSGDSLTVDGKKLTELDQFAGSWTVDSKANKVFTFDGAGGWSYEYYGYRTESLGFYIQATKTVLERKSGRYTVSGDGRITLTGGFSGSATFTDDGMEVRIGSGSYFCHREGSFAGSWSYPDYGMTLRLDGIGEDGRGSGRVSYLYENGVVEFYDLVYSFDNLDNDIICLYIDDEVFGYLYYVPGTDTLNATIYVGPLSSFMQNVNLLRTDEYQGIWVSDKNGLGTLDFNGYGSYAAGSQVGLSGTVTIDGESVAYTLDEATLSGSFIHNGRIYLISYDETRSALILSDGGVETVYSRRDAYADLILTDENGSLYTFDGRGALSTRGLLTVTDRSGKTAEYAYRLSGGEVTLYQGTKNVGRISTSGDSYRLSLGGRTTSLRIRSDFTGSWAMSGSMENLVIGTMDRNGKLTGTVNAEPVIFELVEEGVLTFTYQDSPFYVMKIDDGNLVISAYRDWYLNTDAIYCAPIDELFGHWENSLGASYEFDGMGLSTMGQGLAQSKSSAESESTAFAYRYEYGQYILWTYSVADSSDVVYRLVFCDTDTRRAFISGDRAFTVEKGDNLYRASVRDVDSGVTYLFDGFGTVTTSEGDSYSYKMTSIDMHRGVANVTIEMDGEVVIGTINFSVADDYTMTLN